LVLQLPHWNCIANSLSDSKGYVVSLEGFIYIPQAASFVMVKTFNPGETLHAILELECKEI
jgi:hypothetical protein